MSFQTVAEAASQCFSSSLPLSASVNCVWVEIFHPTWDTCSDLWSIFLETLHAPGAAEYRMAAAAAWSDGIQFFQSAWHLLQLTATPILLLLWYTLKLTAMTVWKYAFVKGLYEHGLDQLQQGAVAIWRFHSSLTPQQWLVELSLIAGLVLAYKLREFLKRQKYVQRAARWYRQRKRRAVQSCCRAVERIARVSRWLAVMTPHAVFWASLVGFKLLVPRALTWAACDTSITTFISYWYPLVATVLVILQYSWDEESNKMREEKQGPATAAGKESKQTTSKERSGSNASQGQTTRFHGRLSGSSNSKKQGFFPKTKPGDPSPRRPRQGASPSTPASARNPTSPLQRYLRAATPSGSRTIDNDIQEMSLGEQEQYWLKYWIVYAAIQTVKLLVWLTPILGRLLTRYEWLAALQQQAELALYLWIFLVPYIIPDKIGDQALPEGRPLPLVISFMAPVFHAAHDVVSNACPEQIWQTWVVSKLESFLNVAVFMSIIRRETADWLVSSASDGRSLVVPGVALLMPYFITAFAVAYVQYVLPITKSLLSLTGRHNGDRRSQVQLSLHYWVLNVIVTGVIERSYSYTWWIPFFTHLQLLLWAYLNLPGTAEHWFGILQEEASALFIFLEGLLGVGHDDEDAVKVEETRTVRGIQWLLDRLPSAAEDQNENNQERSVLDEIVGGQAAAENDRLPSAAEDENDNSEELSVLDEIVGDQAAAEHDVVEKERNECPLLDNGVEPMDVDSNLKEKEEGECASVDSPRLLQDSDDDNVLVLRENNTKTIRESDGPSTSGQRRRSFRKKRPVERL